MENHYLIPAPFRPLKGSPMEALAELQRVVAERHEYARCWKERTGRPVLGYFGTYVPEEKEGLPGYGIPC